MFLASTRLNTLRAAYRFAKASGHAPRDCPKGLAVSRNSQLDDAHRSQDEWHIVVLFVGLRKRSPRNTQNTNMHSSNVPATTIIADRVSNEALVIRFPPVPQKRILSGTRLLVVSSTTPLH